MTLSFTSLFIPVLKTKTKTYPLYCRIKQLLSSDQTSSLITTTSSFLLTVRLQERVHSPSLTCRVQPEPTAHNKPTWVPPRKTYDRILSFGPVVECHSYPFLPWPPHSSPFPSFLRRSSTRSCTWSLYTTLTICWIPDELPPPSTYISLQSVVIKHRDRSALIDTPMLVPHPSFNPNYTLGQLDSLTCVDLSLWPPPLTYTFPHQRKWRIP